MSNTENKAGVIIIINGYPGVGKLTVAEKLIGILPNSKLIDTHLIDELAGSAHTKGSERYELLRSNLFRTVISAICPPLPNTPIYILPMTLTHSSRDLLAPVLALHKTFAIIHIVLTCSTPTHIERLTNDQAIRLVRGQISDESGLVEMKMEDEILHLVGGPRGAGLGTGKVLAEYDIDTSVMDAGVAAGVVAEYAVQGLRDAGVFIILGKKKRTGVPDLSTWS